MGITATAIGCLVGGALIGGGTVAVGYHISEKRKKKRRKEKNVNITKYCTK